MNRTIVFFNGPLSFLNNPNIQSNKDSLQYMRKDRISSILTSPRHKTGEHTICVCVQCNSELKDYPVVDHFPAGNRRQKTLYLRRCDVSVASTPVLRHYVLCLLNYTLNHH